MQTIFEIVSKISTPLALAGVFATIFFYLIKQIIAKDIFPSLTKKLSSEIIIMIINRVFILSLIAMILGFAGYVLLIWIDHPKGLNQDNSKQSSPPVTRTISEANTTPAIQKPSPVSDGSVATPNPSPTSLDETGYIVTLILPSRLNGAEIFVNDQPAIVLEQTPTIVKIEVKKSRTNYRFTAKKGNAECSKQQTILSDNAKITLCE